MDEVNLNLLMSNLEKNGMKTVLVQNRNEVIPIVLRLVKAGDTVAWGGSVTLNECGVIDFLRNGKYNVLDRDKHGLSQEEQMEIFRLSQHADVYFSSSNAITEDGFLYNVDGRSNRVSSIAFGPKKVIITAGINKCVKNLADAVIRVKTVAAPKNCARLNIKTYCATKGVCSVINPNIGFGCDSEYRICRNFLVTSKQATAKDRITVILVDESLGY